jgi:hypothetical protein
MITIANRINHSLILISRLDFGSKYEHAGSSKSGNGQERSMEQTPTVLFAFVRCHLLISFIISSTQIA